jgi:hypothetical protein
VRERHGFNDADGPVIWQPTAAEAHNGLGSRALRP